MSKSSIKSDAREFHLDQTMERKRGPKLRVLCLHGYMQNKDIFRKKLGSFTKLFKEWEFVWIDAPHVVEKTAEGEELRGWYTDPTQQYFTTTKIYGFEETLEYLKGVFKTQGPFDGVLGFSQGGVVTGMLCGLRNNDPKNYAPIQVETEVEAKKDNENNNSNTSEENNTTKPAEETNGAEIANGTSTTKDPKDEKQAEEPKEKQEDNPFIFKFAFIAAAFKTSVPQWDLYKQIDPDLITLHTYGDLDDLVSPDKSLLLAMQFPEKNRTLLPHTGGHYVPTSSAAKEVYKKFSTQHGSNLKLRS